jgi:hypothetical protein
MKKGFLLILSLILLLSLWGCAGEEAETEPIVPSTRETVHYGPPETEAAPTQPPVQPEGQVEVKDVFTDKAVMMDYDMTYYFHIPSIHIPGVNTDEVNKVMYHELYSFIDQYVYENPDYPYLGDMGYLWTVKNGIASIITEVVVGPDSSPNPMYIVYNVDIATGQRVFGEEVLAAFGWAPEHYREQVRSKLETRFLELHESTTGEYQQCYEDTISEDNINNCIVYIDVSGNLAVVADIYTPVAGGCYRHLLCIEGDGEAAYPKAEPFE